MDDPMFPGGGEMGEQLRGFDWATTPLGPVSAWPQSLRTAVSILLDSRFGMYIAWGPAYVQIYNDAYRPILGTSKHPALGRSTPETFAESWHIIGPMFEAVRGGRSTGDEDWMLPLHRNGYLEECYFTFSYSPIRDERGEVGGVHVTVTETTRQVLSTRRLAVLHRLAEQTAGLKLLDEVYLAGARVMQGAPEDLPFALVYQLAPDRRGAGLVAIAGLEPGSPGAPGALTAGRAGGWPWEEALASRTGLDVDDVAERFGPLPGGPWPDATTRAVILPLGRHAHTPPLGFVILGVSPRRELDGEYRGFFRVLADHLSTAITSVLTLEENLRRAERTRSVAEEERGRLYAHFMRAPFPIGVLRGPTHIIELANPEALRVWGKDPTIVGKPVVEGLPELVGQPFVGLLDDVLRTGEAYRAKEALVLLQRGAGAVEQVYFDFVYAPLTNAAGGVDGVLVAGFEVTETVFARFKAEQAQTELRTLVDSIPELAWTARPDGFIDFYNRRWYEYTGTTYEVMQGWGWESVHDPELLPAVIARWQRSLSTGEAFEMQFPLKGADGVFRWFLTRVVPLRGGDGTILRWFGTNTNVHEQREARKRTEALLREVSLQTEEMAGAIRDMRAAKEAAEQELAALKARARDTS